MESTSPTTQTCRRGSLVLLNLKFTLLLLVPCRLSLPHKENNNLMKHASPCEAVLPKQALNGLVTGLFHFSPLTFTKQSVGTSNTEVLAMIMAEGKMVFSAVFYCDLYTKALVKRVFSKPVPQFCIQCCGFAVTGVM